MASRPLPPFVPQPLGANFPISSSFTYLSPSSHNPGEMRPQSNPATVYGPGMGQFYDLWSEFAVILPDFFEFFDQISLFSLIFQNWIQNVRGRMGPPHSFPHPSTNPFR